MSPSRPVARQPSTWCRVTDLRKFLQLVFNILSVFDAGWNTQFHAGSLRL